MMTRPRPIRPAMSPPLSWSEPSDADTDDTDAFSSFNGRAPYFSTVASVFASPWVKLPVICVDPPAMPSCWLRGKDCTTPSSTIAIALQPLGGEQLGTSALVSNAFLVRLYQSSPPLPLKLRSTNHSLVCVLTTALA